MPVINTSRDTVRTNKINSAKLQYEKSIYKKSVVFLPLTMNNFSTKPNKPTFRYNEKNRTKFYFGVSKK